MDKSIGVDSLVKLKPGIGDYTKDAARASKQGRQGVVIAIYGTALPLKEQDLHVKFAARNKREKDIFLTGPRHLFEKS